MSVVSVMQQSKSGSANQSRRILVVGQDCAVRESLIRALSVENYDVASAVATNEAIQLLSDCQIDLVVIDLSLTNESSWEVFLWLSSTRPHLPTIMIAALPNQCASAMTAGADRVIEKPFVVPSLLTSIAELLVEPTTSEPSKPRRLRSVDTCVA